MNPLLENERWVRFDRIQPEHVVPAIRTALETARRDIAALVASPSPRTYENTIVVLEEILGRLDRVIEPVTHLMSVCDSPELRSAFEVAQPEFSDFYARLFLDPDLWAAVRQVEGERERLSPIHQRHLNKLLREFRREGADLSEEARQRLREISVELADLQNRFAEHLMDSTNDFVLVLEEDQLRGLPEAIRQSAAEEAIRRGNPGKWCFTLLAPSYQPFMQYAEDRELRRALYEAQANRASTGDRDNREVIRKILALRREKATMLGYASYAELVLEESMAGSVNEARNFVHHLAEGTRAQWQQESQEMMAEAADLGIATLEPWDVPFVVERMRRLRFGFDSEEVRAYFPLDRVLTGMFALAQTLFGVRVTPVEVEGAWHPDVQTYDLHDEEGRHLGVWYADWYARPTKQGGAWMSGFRVARMCPAEPGAAFVVCNFTPPRENFPCLLRAREVETVFHEFGHLLHHCLSRVVVPGLGGTRVSRDWVELPSQIMENWVWEPEFLDTFASHFVSQTPFPRDLLAQLLRSKKFMAASEQMRQLSMAALDLALHADYEEAADGDVISFAQDLIAGYTIHPGFARNHFLCGFAHIFAWSYAAGYYSYKWCEVLEADAFTRFKKEGLLNRDTGRAFVRSVLERGNSEDPAVLFREFMGRDPDQTAMLQRLSGGEEA